MEIRLATAADAPALARLNAAFNGVQMSPECMAEQLTRCSGVESALIAYNDDQAIGFACLRLIPWLCYNVMYAEVTELFVVEAFRRRGVASALVARAEQLRAKQAQQNCASSPGAIMLQRRRSTRHWDMRTRC